MDQEFAAAQPVELVLPAEAVFLNGGEAAPPAAMRPPGSGLPGSGLLGPGLFESIAWMIGMQIVQFAALIFATVLLFAGFMFSEGLDLAQIGAAQLIGRLLPFFRDNQLVILALRQAGDGDCADASRANQVEREAATVRRIVARITTDLLFERGLLLL
jgi:hypothetical protein